MSVSEPSGDVVAAIQRRWLLLALAVGAALSTSLVVGLLGGGNLGGVVLSVLVATLAGLLVGLVVIWIVERLDDTIRRPADLAKLTSVPNLAVVPCHRAGGNGPDDVVMFRDPNSMEAEGYRSVRTGLDFLMSPATAAPVEPMPPAGNADDPSWQTARPVAGNVVLVTSAQPAEGIPGVAANLAAAAAMAGRRVVLVDGDLRKPRLHRLFRLKNEEGLSSILAGEAKGFSVVQWLEAVKRLVVLSAGPPPPDPADLLASGRLGVVLRSLSQKADLVVVAAPPVLAATDSAIIAQECDGVVMVATAGVSGRGDWAEALRRLAVVEAEVVATVMLREDDRVRSVVPSYRHPPSAVAQTWWVSRAAEAFGSDDEVDDPRAEPPSRAVSDGWPTPRVDR